MKIALYTLLALLAFAGNSILCRLALGDNAIDAASFTAIRLLSGIVVLAIIIQMSPARSAVTSKGSWKASFVLFMYALTFSYAYVSLDTGLGALILFCVVQITMIFVGLLTGNKLHYFEWGGVIVAFSGFVYLVMPGITAPSLLGFSLMSISGIAWACYTLAGKGSVNPLSDTCYNFLRTLPMVIILVIVTIQQSTITQEGIVLAMLSGGLASGVGYTIWYAALGGLSAIHAAVVQLLVPVLAAVGGIIFADEALSVRLAISSLVILGGVLTVIIGKHYAVESTHR